MFCNLFCKHENNFLVPTWACNPSLVRVLCACEGVKFFPLIRFEHLPLFEFRDVIWYDLCPIASFMMTLNDSSSIPLSLSYHFMTPTRAFKSSLVRVLCVCEGVKFFPFIIWFISHASFMMTLIDPQSHCHLAITSRGIMYE